MSPPQKSKKIRLRKSKENSEERSVLPKQLDGRKNRGSSEGVDGADSRRRHAHSKLSSTDDQK